MLELIDIKLEYPGGFGKEPGARAIDGVSLSLATGKALGIVGESGAGKTTLAQVACGLLRPTAGQVHLDGSNIHAGRLSRPKLARQVQMVWQNPSGSLDPRLSVGRSLAEPLKIHGLGGDVAGLLAAVGLPATMADRLPAELSGGEAQRVVIARALATGPRLLVCDEPTAALDVSTRLEVAGLLSRLRSGRGLSLMLITHDLDLAARLTGEVAIMYAGRIVESGPTAEVLASPLHPYTRLLVESEPQLGRKADDLPAVTGLDAHGAGGGEGCAFLPRCRSSEAGCHSARPGLLAVSAGRSVACPPAATARSQSGAAAV